MCLPWMRMGLDAWEKLEGKRQLCVLDSHRV